MSEQNTTFKFELSPEMLLYVSRAASLKGVTEDEYVRDAVIETLYEAIVEVEKEYELKILYGDGSEPPKGILYGGCRSGT